MMREPKEIFKVELILFSSIWGIKETTIEYKEHKDQSDWNKITSSGNQIGLPTRNK